MQTLKRFAGLVLAAALLAACGGGTGPAPELPTAVPTEDVGSEAVGAAESTPEETWDNYLRDTIAERNRILDITENLVTRYQDPELTSQSNRLPTNISLREDRSEVGSGSVNADFDIQVTYLNGDSETLTCTYNIGLRAVGEGEEQTYYIVNPNPLAFQSGICN